MKFFKLGEYFKSDEVLITFLRFLAMSGTLLY